jgi:hypothetical protein
VNKVLSSVKAAINANMNAAVSYSVGHGQVAEIMNMINGENIKNRVLDCSIVEPSDMVIASFREGDISFSVSQEILDAEVIIVERLSSEYANESIQRYVDSMMQYRTICNVELTNLKSVIILYSSFDEMMSAVEESECATPILLAAF